MTVDEVLEAVAQMHRDLAASLTHQADELDAIANEKAKEQKLAEAAYSAGAAAGLRAVIRAFDRQAA